MNKKIATMVAAMIMLMLRMCSPSEDGDVSIDPEHTNPVESTYYQEVETTQDPSYDVTTPEEEIPGSDPTEKEDNTDTTLPQPEPDTSMPTEPESDATAPTEPGLGDSELPPV